MKTFGLKLKEYLTTGAGTEGSLLIDKTIHNQIIAAADKKLIGRQYAAQFVSPDMIRGSSYDFDLETADSSTVFQIAQGAPVPISTPSFTSTNVKPVKYGARPAITMEMMEDGKFNLMQYSLERLGKEFAENESSLVVSALDGANTTVAGGAAITLANINTAILNIDNADYEADTMFVGTEVANDLRNIDTFVEADKFGSREMLQTGQIGSFLGLDVVKISSAIMTSTSAYVFDRSEAYAVVEKRPITTKPFDDLVHDIQNATVTQRLAVSLLRSTAVSKITTS